MEDWSAWLAEADEAEELQMLRRNVEKGLPCGSEGFVQKLGRQVGRLLEYRPWGRPKKVKEMLINSSLRGAKRRGNPEMPAQSMRWIAALRSQ